jgi:DedD protein
MDKALKQRLVGAIVLIALAVIVLPMIFGGRPSATGPETRSIELPAEPPDLDFETRRFPVGSQDEPGAERGPTVEVEPAEEVAGSETIPSLPQPDSKVVEVAPEDPELTELLAETGDEGNTPDSGDATEPADQMDTLVAELTEAAQSQEKEQEQEPESQPQPQPSGTVSRYVVQVASFGNSDNAVRLSGQLEEAGYTVLLDNVSSETGDLNRVRVGPYASESEAQNVATQLRDRFSGVNPRIVDMQPEASSPALANEDPLMRWVVQVGSFSSQDNARDLVARLRAQGLSAYDETVTARASTIYRVRVGPYLDRTEALSAEQKISDDIGIDGVVMSSD